MWQSNKFTKAVIVLIMVFALQSVWAQPRRSRKSRKWVTEIGYIYQPLKIDISGRSFFENNKPDDAEPTKKISASGNLTIVPLTLINERWHINTFRIGLETVEMGLGQQSYGYMGGIGGTGKVWKDQLFYRVMLEYHNPLLSIPDAEYIELDEDQQWILQKDGRLREPDGFLQFSAGLRYEYKLSKIWSVIAAINGGYMYWAEMDSWQQPTDETYYYSDQPYRSFHKYVTIPDQQVRYKMNDFSGFFVNFNVSFLLDL